MIKRFYYEFPWLDDWPEDATLDGACFFDIETTGLSRQYSRVYLTCLAAKSGDKLLLLQLLAPNRSFERELLSETFEELRKFHSINSFNGDSFDLPFLQERAQHLRLTTYPFELKSRDLLKEFRPYQQLFGWENCRLKTMERTVGVNREDMFNGGQLISLYEEYEGTGDATLERILLLHNREDVADMPALLKIPELAKWVYSLAYKGPAPDGVELCGEDMPRDLAGLELAAGKIEIGAENIVLKLSGCERTLRHYLPNYKDYYVKCVPDGKTELVHKKLAAFLDKSELRTARQSECYLEHTARFMKVAPGLAAGLPIYREEPFARDGYIRVDALPDAFAAMSREEFQAWLTTYLN